MAAIVLVLCSIVVFPPTADAMPKSTATVKEYKTIKNGQKCAKAREVIGDKGQQVTSGEAQGSYTWVWRSTGKDVYVRFNAGNVVRKLRVADKIVSHSEYKKIKKGQSYTRVMGIVREKGELLWKYDDESAYFWCSADPKYYVATYFDHNKLEKKEYIHWLDAPSYWPTKPRSTDRLG